MKKLKVKIEGISPLLMHRFNEQPKDTIKKNLKKNQDKVEEYLYLDENKQLCQPATHIIGTLKGAGVKYQIPGQGKLTYKNLMGSGAIVIYPDMILHIYQAWEIDIRPVVIKGSRILRSRPMLKEWALQFEIEYDDDEISKAMLKELFEYAGKRCGIGDYRPQKGGSFGRFIVTLFEDI